VEDISSKRLAKEGETAMVAVSLDYQKTTVKTTVHPAPPKKVSKAGREAIHNFFAKVT